MALNNSVRWLIASMLVTALVFTGLSPTKVSAAPSWPTSWITIDGVDPDEGKTGGSRDVQYAYYQVDSEYIYLRLQTYETSVLSNKDRYKWFFGGSTMTFPGSSGGTVQNWAYLFYLADTNNDGIGEIYLGTPSNQAGTLITDTNTAGYQINVGGYYVDLYLRLDQIPGLTSYKIGWATDQANPNYDQAPKEDSIDYADPITIAIKGSITVNKVVPITPPSDSWQFNYTGPGGTLGSFTIAAAGGSQTVSNLPFGSYTITETTKVCYSCTTANPQNVVLSAAQPNGTVNFTNNFTAIAPTVESIDIYRALDNQVADSMTPQTPYYAKVRVFSCSKLSYVKTVQVTLFYNDGSHPNAPTSGNTQTCAILTWTASPEGWSISPSGGYPTTTWALDSGSCSRPADLNVQTGDWKFYFTPGKVATEAPSTAYLSAHWDAQGAATDQLSQTGQLYIRNKAMNWYGEVAVTGTVDWGEVPLGLKFEDAPNPKTVSITYISNGDYYEDIESSATWQNPPAPAAPTETVTLDNDGNNPPGAGKFSLKADNIAVYSGDAIVVISTQYGQINASGSLTGETGVTNTANGLWLSLGETGIAPVTYSGTINYQISDR